MVLGKPRREVSRDGGFPEKVEWQFLTLPVHAQFVGESNLADGVRCAKTASSASVE
jgi:hypothetical protein